MTVTAGVAGVMLKWTGAYWHSVVGVIAVVMGDDGVVAHVDRGGYSGAAAVVTGGGQRAGVIVEGNEVLPKLARVPSLANPVTEAVVAGRRWRIDPTGIGNAHSGVAGETICCTGLALSSLSLKLSLSLE